MSNPNEYLRRIAAQAEIITEYADTWEESGFKGAVEEIIEKLDADGFTVSVDSIAGFMCATTLIASVEEQMAEMNPIRGLMAAMSGPMKSTTLTSAVGSELSRRFITGESS